MLNNNETESDGTRFDTSGNESDSSINIIRGIRQANVDEDAILVRIAKIEKKHASRMQNSLKQQNINNAVLADKTEQSRKTFSNDSETSFRQTAISRSQRKSIRSMREEEEEQTMIFFEKNNMIHADENKSSSEDEQSNEYLDRNYDDTENPIIDSDEGRRDSSKVSHNLILREIFDWTKHIAIAVIIGLLLVMFVIQRNVVIGSSMEPNLYENDQLIVQKVSKLFNYGITYGDIITINAEGFLGHSGDKNIIKRVIGVPGDVIDINEDGVYRNSIKLNETYLTALKTSEREPSFSHVTLGENQFYVMGDNRSVSLDSRMFGPVDKSRIIGEVLVRFYPLDKFGRP